MARIHFNITLALIWNALAVVLSAAGILTPVTAALVHNAGSVLVVVSSALLIADTKGTAGGKGTVKHVPGMNNPPRRIKTNWEEAESFSAG
jgi:hypothetical protein